MNSTTIMLPSISYYQVSALQLSKFEHCIITPTRRSLLQFADNEVVSDCADSMSSYTSDFFVMAVVPPFNIQNIYCRSFHYVVFARFRRVDGDCNMS